MLKSSKKTAASPIRNAVRFSRRLLRCVRGQDLLSPRDIRCRTEPLGDDGGDWTICPDLVDQDSIVYSVGVGKEISFDLALIEEFGVTVHAFDPTPESIEWVASQSLPAKFVFHPVGLADFDGEAQFNPPANPDHVSHSMAIQHSAENSPIKVPVRRFSTLLDELGHPHVDLLKIDIEGAEYDVIPDVLQSPGCPRQFLVEFHHWFPSVPPKRTKNTIGLMRSAGFRLFSVAPNGREYAFLRQS